MEGPEAGLTTAVQEATEMRRHIGAQDIVIHWTNAHGEVALIVDADGWDIFVNGVQVPRTLAQVVAEA